MKSLINFIHRIEPDKAKSPFMHTLFDGFFTFLFAPKEVTKNGVHIRDGMDLKRTMIMVVLAMQFCYIFGTLNIGHQHFAALGLYDGSVFEGLHLKIAYGLVKLIPIFVVTHIVGLGIEFFYAAKKGHAIEEGFLVSAALIPLIMPPDLPLWMLAVAIAFAVIIGKEAFGGTGMNILNIALLARVFVFFAYPTEISGDEVWISGLEKDVDTRQFFATEYNFVFGFFDSIFEMLNWKTFAGSVAPLVDAATGHAYVADGFTGATPLALAAKGGWAAVTEYYTPSQMLWGWIPGSIGEACKPFILVGAAILVFTGIGSWRVMVSMIVGAIFTTLLFNAVSPMDLTNSADVFKFMAVPWYYQFYMGSFFFAMAFMATDPVTAASTNTGKLIYGFLIGSIGMVIRVLNPAYPEGWMLAILLLNVFAPLIDHYVLEANISKRLSRA